MADILMEETSQDGLGRSNGLSDNDSDPVSNGNLPEKPVVKEKRRKYNTSKRTSLSSGKVSKTVLRGNAGRVTGIPGRRPNGTCKDCGFKTRHARNCKYKNKYTKPVVEKKPKVPKKPRASRENDRYHPDNFDKDDCIIDFSKLDIQALRRYKKFYKLTGLSKTNISKSDLIKAIQKHFNSVQIVDEILIIRNFITFLRSH